MKPSKQDIFNQYRENVIIEVVQAVARSAAGPRLAFKGGTALKLFFELPRFSEDLDYDTLAGVSPGALLSALETLAGKNRWEITDAAVKRHTVLLELRFAGPERNFRLKAEISTREKEVETAVRSLRGVPVTLVEPSQLMTEKLVALVERRAGRDLFDAWYILRHAYPLNDRLVDRHFGGVREMYAAVLEILDQSNPKQVLRDTGKLLGPDYRNWIRDTFLADFKRMVRSRMDAPA